MEGKEKEMIIFDAILWWVMTTLSAPTWCWVCWWIGVVATAGSLCKSMIDLGKKWGEG